MNQELIFRVRSSLGMKRFTFNAKQTLKDLRA
jgi:hypothetical protein